MACAFFVFLLKILLLDATQASAAQDNRSIRDLLLQPQMPFNPNVMAAAQHQQQPQSSGNVEILETVVLRAANEVPSTSNQPSVPIRSMLFCFSHFPFLFPFSLISSHFLSLPLSTPTEIAEPQPSTSSSLLRFKADPDAPEHLLAAHRAYKSFKTMNAFKIVVRPYILEDYARKLDIDMITQFALYKCMHDACLFACDSEEKWIIHMEQHSSLIDLLGEQLKKRPDYKNELLKFGECPYCGYEPNRRKDVKFRLLDAVCRHMEIEHIRNTIQCAHCYYRTNEMDNIILHMERYHPHCDRKILLCGIHREFQDSDLEELKQCDQHITRIKCNLCKFSLGFDQVWLSINFSIFSDSFFILSHPNSERRNKGKMSKRICMLQQLTVASDYRSCH